ncbi:DNA damage-inducible protein 1-like [Chenopodium quinoa]|uniref:DNA damage-inducible protein 1-like n=1 Tax=Chenopodium quinoa TaxID=63459 RepID=UPI000B78FFA9|nr:DNA damage-inducible protein 1-like [Chenopodium quinoa]
MENQISQLANQFSQVLKTPGTFPAQTEQSQKGQMNVVTLRSGKQLEDPPTKESSREVIEEVSASEKEVEDARVEEASKEAPPKPHAPYMPKVPFPQRLAQAKLEKKFSKFLDVLKKLHINIPFLDAISEMPSYNTLPKKLGDPGSYSIPVKLGDIEINRALCDLGASVSLMPLSMSICKKLQMGELKPTRISLQLADRSVKFPFGVLEDVPLQVGKFFIPCDFVVMEMDEDVNVPIILGRPFLATAGAIIDMKKGKITFEVGDEKLEYSLLNVMGAPSMGDTVCQVDVLDELQNEQLPLNQNDDALEQVLLGKEDDNGDW